MSASSLRLRLLATLTAGLLGCATLGCVTLDPWVKKHEAPPTGQVTQVAVTWDKGIALVPDFTHGGAMIPGLLCRIYLFGADGAFPLAGDGTISVDLFDDTPLTAGGEPIQKERWNFDKDTLKGCMRKDLVGWGYSLFLPLATYSPALKQVHMMVCYTPQHGFPFYSPSQTMALVHPAKNGQVLAKQGNSASARSTQTAKTDDALSQSVSARK